MLVLAYYLFWFPVDACIGLVSLIVSCRCLYWLVVSSGVLSMIIFACCFFWFPVDACIALLSFLFSCRCLYWFVVFSGFLSMIVFVCCFFWFPVDVCVGLLFILVSCCRCLYWFVVYSGSLSMLVLSCCLFWFPWCFSGLLSWLGHIHMYSSYTCYSYKTVLINCHVYCYTHLINWRKQLSNSQHLTYLA